MKRAVLTFCFLSVCAALAGCGNKEYTGDERFPLSDKVTYDGDVVDHGAISFIPITGDKQRPSGGVIKDGVYSVPEPKGANAGKYRVEIHWLKLTGKQVKAQDSEDILDERAEVLPAKFHKDSQLTAEVGPNQTTFDFDLKSK
jgi:predicted small lipoprotein YifL